MLEVKLQPFLQLNAPSIYVIINACIPIIFYHHKSVSVKMIYDLTLTIPEFQYDLNITENTMALVVEM